MHTTAKLILVVAVTAILVAAGTFLLWKGFDGKTLLPDRAPANIEENAVINGAETNKPDTTTDNDGVSLNYAKEVTIDLSAKTATLYFENPASSLYDASIFLVIKETVVLQSGLLPPGSLLTSLSLPDEGVPLQEGGYDAAILVQFYDENGDPLAVNARIEGITVEVK